MWLTSRRRSWQWAGHRDELRALLICSRDEAARGHGARLPAVPLPSLRTAVQRAQRRRAEPHLPAQRRHRLRGVLPATLPPHLARPERDPGAAWDRGRSRGCSRLEGRRQSAVDETCPEESAAAGTESSPPASAASTATSSVPAAVTTRSSPSASTAPILREAPELRSVHVSRGATISRTGWQRLGFASRQAVRRHDRRRATSRRTADFGQALQGKSLHRNTSISTIEHNPRLVRQARDCTK